MIQEIRYYALLPNLEPGAQNSCASKVPILACDQGHLPRLPAAGLAPCHHPPPVPVRHRVITACRPGKGTESSAVPAHSPALTLPWVAFCV